MIASAAAVAAAVRVGERKAVDVVAETLEAIARANPELNAFCEIRSDEAYEMARVIDRMVGRGIDPGPLAGVPIGLKDSIWEAGRPATAGSRALTEFVPQESAVIVSRLARSGAVIIGRTNVSELCYLGNCSNDLYGTTANPWDLGRTSGGSSGGSAAAVASGMVPLAVGADGGGSIRIPASFCGVVGLKPTYGLVPREPQWPGWWTLLHVGPLAFTVEDCALMLSVVAGPDDSDPVSLPPLGRNYLAAARSTDRLSGLKVAYSADLGYVERIDSGVRTAFRDAIGRFADLGIVLKEDCPAVGNPIHDWNTLVAADSYASDGDLLASDRLGDDAREMIKAGLQVTGPAYAGARNKQMAFAAKWSHFMRDYDLMLTPTMECVAFPLGRVRPEFLGGKRLGDEYTEIACTPSDDSSMFCIAANMTGQPAITVPMGLAEDGLPVGLQIIGRRFEDDLVLRAAAAWERISPWPRPGAFSGAGRLTNG